MAMESTERDELREQVERLQRELDEAQAAYAESENENAQLASEVKSLRAALKEYGCHYAGCLPGVHCDCGLASALA